MTEVVPTTAVEVLDVEVLPAVAWSGAPGGPADPTAAIARLPNPGLDPFDRLAQAFLAGYGPTSREAYSSDLRAWRAWCDLGQVHPFDARRHHVEAWIRVMTEHPHKRTGRPMAPSSVARRLSVISKFYEYAIDAEVLAYSPVAHARRPHVPTDSTTVALSAGELAKLLDAAGAHSLRSRALVTLLAYNGLRINEALSLDIADYTYDQGARVVRVRHKRGKRSTEPLAPPTVRALDDYIAERSSGPVFLNREGTARLHYNTAAEQLRRLAHRAEIPAAAVVSPHALRHTYITALLGAGVPLQDVQDSVGHSDPRTTRRYDHSQLSNDSHPTHTLAKLVERATKPTDVGNAAG